MTSDAERNQAMQIIGHEMVSRYPERATPRQLIDALADAGLLRTGELDKKYQLVVGVAADGVVALGKANNDRDRAVAETAALRDTVRALHQPHECTGYPDCNPLFGGGCAHAGDCRECRREHPCPTIRALDGGQ